MRVPLTWLREYVPVTAPSSEIADRLAVSTAEVERIAHRGVPDVDGNLGLYRVGRVLTANKHPNADRLQLCQVDVGEREPRQIVCGAWNFGAGATVAVALPGAVLSGGRRLERAELRGTVSDGMILSEHELELGPDHSGILVLPGPWEPGTPLSEVIPLAEEVLELETTPNRPDLLSVYGVAREVAALFRLELAPAPAADLPEQLYDAPLSIEVADLEACPRYDGRLFRSVEIGQSPPWLRARLLAAGMRPISNVVDATNYVMLALGNPTHAFDWDKLAEGRIVVRLAREGETLQTIDGTERTLAADDLVIADAERAVGLAGIMGGLETEVGEATKNVLLETANFEPIRILRSSERHGLRTEGSSRWEKGVDPHLVPHAAALATQLIVSLAGGAEPRGAEIVGELPEKPVVSLRPERVDAIAGIEVPGARQREILERLGFEVDDGSGVLARVVGSTPWTVIVPTWRARDVTREIDLVEEVVRIHGLDQVPFTLPLRSVVSGRLTREQRARRLVEDALVGAGFFEAFTSTLVAEDTSAEALRLPEPLSAEQAILRTTLLQGLVGAARHNLAAGNEEIALFEVARVYLPTGERLPQERIHVGGICEGGFFRAKGAVEVVYDALHVEPRFHRSAEPFLHSGKAARADAGWVGELHPALLPGEWGAFELDLAALFARIPDRIVYEDVITYPAVRQDLAFVVDEEVLARDLLEAAREAAGRELREARVFDVYRGGQIADGKKSIAFRASFQSPERTLSDADARAIRDRIVSALADRFGAELRA
ncbi:MAG: phenylalanine--tRNA ligase subunit beta [Actinomycetota bacterium]|nr:phenylalanine--tRNA ligase subunit beta [Actinomycetota bacterium]